MKLFFKHLLCSTRKKPLQPILLAITLTLAVMGSVFTFALDRAINQETESAQKSVYGAASLTVTLNDASASRFMFASDAELLLGKRAAVAGSFDLPMTMGENKRAVSGVAVDFSKIESIFKFTFTEYGTLTPSGIPSAAFVTQAFANANGLAIGSRFEVSTLGEVRTYTVTGITAAPAIASYDVVVDVSGVTRLIAGDSFLLSSLKDGFRPCNTIYVKVLEGTVDEAIACLSADAAFAEHTFTNVAGAVATENHTQALSVILDVAIVLTCLLAAAVAFCCLYVLSYEREAQNRSFIIAGAPVRTLHLLQFAEVLAHWVIACILGTLVAFAAMRGLVSAAGFRSAAALQFGDALKGMLLILAVAMLTVLLFVAFDRLRLPIRPIKLPMQVFFAPAALTALLMLLVLVLPVRARFSLYIPFVILAVLSLFFYTAPLLCKLLQLGGAYVKKQMLSAGEGRFSVLHYAIKNVSSVKILQNTARLVALLAFVVISISAVMTGATGHIRAAENAFTTEYVVLGATDRCYQKVSECETVQSVHRLYMHNATDEKGEMIILLAADGAETLSEHLRPKNMPQGNRVAISRGEARARGLRVGDTFTVNTSGKSLTVEVGEIMNVSIGCMILDAKHFGLNCNMLAVNGKQDAPAGAVVEELSAKTATEMASLMRTEELWSQRLSAMEIYLYAGRVLLWIVVAIALIGLADNLWQSYRSRKKEFDAYHLSGMSRGQVRYMMGAEILSVLLFGVLLAALAAYLFLMVTNVAMRAHAYELFASIRQASKIK